MSEAAYYRPENVSDEVVYRELSKSAVVCLVFAVLGLLAFWAPVFIIMPILGVLFGFLALTNIKRYPEELVGKGIATAGLVACLVFAVGSIGLHSWIFATEVPENHRRISFSDLKPNPRLRLPFSEKAEEFDGQKIFIKGYVRASRDKYNLKQFILVGDFGSCCFGGNPDIADVVAVRIVGDMTVNHSYNVRRVSGTFHLNKNPVPIGDAEVPQVFYTITADDVY